jgi:hypothetical protein
MYPVAAFYYWLTIFTVTGIICIYLLHGKMKW